VTIDIITLFPEIFEPLLSSSSIAKAQKRRKLKVNLINLRDFGLGPHKQVDDRPYGGGVGMVLRADVIAKAIEKQTDGRRQTKQQGTKTVLLTPQGKTLDQKLVQELAKEKHLILICGHYEGVDERVRELVDDEISIGDYILSGGEVPAMVVLDAVARLIPGVLEKEAIENESFAPHTLDIKRRTLLEPPQYTRPEVLQLDKRKLAVPKILLSGNHQEIEKWRFAEALKKTKKRRPDLLDTKGS